MSFLKRLFGPKPTIAKSKYKTIEEIKSTSFIKKTVGSGYSMEPDVHYIVASVELGNTTTKCIITATNLRTSRTYLLDKTVKMTRDVRPPKPGEKVFGKTIWGVELTKESVADLVKDTIHESAKRAKLDIKKDIHFVVRSTGVTAGFASPEEVGKMIKALAEGCLKAGIPPARMTPALSLENLPKEFQDYSLLDKIAFDGAVAGVLPPTGREVVANEMEGELVTAGIKLGAKWTDVDFRNPCVSMDFGTTLAGRIVNSEKPYAKTVGNFCGLAGAIPDAIIKGTNLVDKKLGAVLDVKATKGKYDAEKAQEYAEEVHKYIDIRKVPKSRSRFGTVPVDPKAAENAGTVLIGCDVGKNGSKFHKLSELGKEIYENDGLELLFGTIDYVSALIAKRLVEEAVNEDIIEDGSVLGVTGRAGITGKKPELILEYVNDYFEDCVFVSDGLALGAAMMARCMNSLGTPRIPIGGNRGDRCILAERLKYHKKKQSGGV